MGSSRKIISIKVGGTYGLFSKKAAPLFSIEELTEAVEHDLD